MTSKAIVNSAHFSGNTYLTFSADGRFAYTGGSGSLVRIWDTQDGGFQEPETAFEAESDITSISAARDCWFSGSKDGCVRCYETGKPDFKDLVTDAHGASIHCVAVDPKGKRVAVTSEEITVKLIDLEDTSNIVLLKGHKKGIRKATWHPSGTFLTTSGSDGDIIVWDVSEDEPKQVKTITGVIPAIPDSEYPDFGHDCSAVWHPSGDFFFAATRSHDIVAISRAKWEKLYTLSDDQQLGAVTALALSANGVYLASASTSSVFIWSTQNHRVLFRLPASKDAVVTQLAFSPTENLLAWTDTEGVLTRYPQPIPATSPDPVKPPRAVAGPSVPVRRQPELDLFGDVADDGAAVPAPHAPADDEDPDSWIDDDVGGYLEKDDTEIDRRRKEGAFELVRTTPAQKHFQPCATPMDKISKKRVLAHNHLGSILVTDQDTHHIVDVQTQSLSDFRKGYVFTDYDKYAMASLGERGIAFAFTGDAERRAHVAFRPWAMRDTGTWARDEEWKYELPAGVQVLGIAVGGPAPAEPSAQSTSRRTRAIDDDGRGRGHVVVATSLNELSFLTGFGLERYSMGLDGDFVTMVAGPEWVFVVHRDGSMTVDGQQNLKGTLICFDDFLVLQERRLPLPKSVELKWIGITEEGAPTIYDSSGVLYVMPRFRMPLRATWARLLDTKELAGREGKDETYWPFAVNQKHFRCIILKGLQAHPPIPLPVHHDMDVVLPFRGTLGEDLPFEEKLARQTMFLDIERDALEDELTTKEISKGEDELDASLLALITKAATNTQEKPTRTARALALVRLLHHETKYAAVRSIAQFTHVGALTTLVDRLEQERALERRLADARDARRRVRGDVDAVTPDQPLLAQLFASLQAAKPDLLGNFGKAAPVDRPGLMRAIPVASSSGSTLQPAAQSGPNGPNGYDTPQKVADAEEPYPWDSPPQSDGKRKRLEEDDVAALAADTSAKRRALDQGVATNALKPKANPFARKAAPDTSRNPFARNAENAKSLHKSESFFDKVEAAETDKGKRTTGAKGKGKDRKEVTRQTTLFGLPPRSAPETAKGRKKKSAPSESASAATAVGVESQDASETQTTDVTMTDTPTEETQQNTVESQNDEGETQTIEEDTLPANMDGSAEPPAVGIVLSRPPSPVPAAIEAEA